MAGLMPRKYRLMTRNQQVQRANSNGLAHLQMTGIDYCHCQLQPDAYSDWCTGFTTNLIRQWCQTSLNSALRQMLATKIPTDVFSSFEYVARESSSYSINRRSGLQPIQALRPRRSSATVEAGDSTDMGQWRLRRRAWAGRSFFGIPVQVKR